MEKKYVVLEIQTMADGKVACLVTAYDDQMQAESAYHSVLAAAALSKLPRHAAVLLTSDGSVQVSQYYEHSE
jgi:hypothetical protein